MGKMEFGENEGSVLLVFSAMVALVLRIVRVDDWLGEMLRWCL